MRDRVNKLSRSGSAIGVDDSNVIGIIIEQTERSLNVITVHFAMSLRSNLDDQLKIQADWVYGIKMKLNLRGLEY